MEVSRVAKSLINRAIVYSTGAYIQDAIATLVQALEEIAQFLDLEGGEPCRQVRHIQAWVREPEGASPHQTRAHL